MVLMHHQIVCAGCGNPPAPACQGHPAASVGNWSVVCCLLSAVSHLLSAVLGLPNHVMSLPSTANVGFRTPPGTMQKAIEIQASVLIPKSTPRGPKWQPKGIPKSSKITPERHPNIRSTKGTKKASKMGPWDPQKLSYLSRLSSEMVKSRGSKKAPKMIPKWMPKWSQNRRKVMSGGLQKKC